jgi:hypothetical protein
MVIRILHVAARPAGPEVGPPPGRPLGGNPFVRAERHGRAYHKAAAAGWNQFSRFVVDRPILQTAEQDAAGWGGYYGHMDSVRKYHQLALDCLNLAEAVEWGLILHVFLECEFCPSRLPDSGKPAGDRVAKVRGSRPFATTYSGDTTVCQSRAGEDPQADFPGICKIRLRSFGAHRNVDRTRAQANPVRCISHSDAPRTSQLASRILAATAGRYASSHAKASGPFTMHSKVLQVGSSRVSSSRRSVAYCINSRRRSFPGRC